MLERIDMVWSAHARGLELHTRLLQPCHPSESAAHRRLRTLAWGLFYREGIRFNGDSICRPELPDLEAPATGGSRPLAVMIAPLSRRRLRRLPGDAALMVLAVGPDVGRAARAALTARRVADRAAVRVLTERLPDTVLAGGRRWQVVEMATRLHLDVDGAEVELGLA